MDESYESARRLLSQLRTVARRLSSGLDTVTVADQLLETVIDTSATRNSAVFVQTEGGVLAPLGLPRVRRPEKLSGPRATWSTVAGQSRSRTRRSALRCRRRTEGTVSCSRFGVAFAHDRYRHARRARPPASEDTPLPDASRWTSMRCGSTTAFAFDEIRSIATMEERHRLAREIHDGIAQEIASLGYVVDDLSATAGSDSQRRKLQALRSRAHPRGQRAAAVHLRPAQRSCQPGWGRPSPTTSARSGARSGLTVHLTLGRRPDAPAQRGRDGAASASPRRRSPTPASTPSADNLWVDCRIQPPYARISVRDDGDGLGTPRDDSYGIKIMRERAARISADLEITEQSAGGATPGTKVTVTVGADQPALPGADYDVGGITGMSTTMHTVVLVDDHDLIRQGLARAFERHPDFDVVGEAATVGEGIAIATSLKPDRRGHRRPPP